MNISQIEYFLAVADKLNFTAAAKLLFISQPALSKQIFLLEEELETKLFIRNSKKVELTKEGKKFREDTQEILRMMKTAKKNVKMMGDKDVLRIGCFDGAIVDDFLPQIVDNIKEISPKTKVKIRRNSFNEIRNSLDNDEVDIIFTLDLDLSELYSYNNKNIISRKVALVYSDKFHLANKKNLTLKDFSGSKLLVLEPTISQGCYRDSLELVNELKLKNLKIEKVDNFISLFTYMEMGHGFIFICGDVVDKREDLRRIELPASKSKPFFVIAVWKNENPIVKELMNNY